MYELKPFHNKNNNSKVTEFLNKKTDLKNRVKNHDVIFMSPYNNTNVIIRDDLII